MTDTLRFRVNSPKVINETLDGEAVIINLDSGFYYSLDPVGSRIWDALGKNASVDDISALLAQFHEGSAESMKSVVMELIAEFQKENLVVPAEPGAPKFESSASKPSSKTPFTKPKLNKFGDMQDLLLLDPIHEVDEQGWPHTKENTPPPK